MKIGILTFHWATNYGAVIQCYALQTYLEELGHRVSVINYKPKQYDESLYTFFRFKKFLCIKEYVESKRKESNLKKYRKDRLNLTQRFYSYKDLSVELSYYDVIISGSDQILNPFFLMNGEKKGKISPTYFLDFSFVGKKIGYAVSFGCVKYPISALPIAAKFIQNFDYISVREKTGIDIVSSLGRNDAILVPDPTLLIESDFYHKQADEVIRSIASPYIYNFFIRHISSRKSSIKSKLHEENLLWNNEDGNYSMQGWLSKIKHADFVITDSFHCMVMCLKLHKPFIVVVEERGNVGMNDRLYSLLEPLGLTESILHKDDINELRCPQKEDFDWESIDKELYTFKLKGQTFLNCI